MTHSNLWPSVVPAVDHTIMKNNEWTNEWS